MKGKDACNIQHNSKLEAEMALLSFRQGRKGRKSVEKHINESIIDANARPALCMNDECYSEDLSDLAPNSACSLFLLFSNNPNSSAAPSIPILNFDIKSDDKKSKMRYPKRKETDMSSKHMSNPKILTQNSNASGSFGSSFNQKSRKRIKDCLLVPHQRHKHRKLG